MELESQTNDGRQKVYVRIPRREHERYDLKMLFRAWTPLIKTVLDREVSRLYSRTLGYKFQLVVQVVLKKFTYSETGEIASVQRVDPHFLSLNYRYDPHAVDDDIRTMYKQIETSFDGYVNNGSGWFLDQIVSQKLKLFRFRKISGGASRGTCKLPVQIVNKRACRTIDRCSDQKCFVYCLLLAMFPKIGARKELLPSHFFGYTNRLNTRTIKKWPMTVDGLPDFERANSAVSINVFCLERNSKKGVYRVAPLYHSQSRRWHDRDDYKPIEVNLLLYRRHFYLITSMSRLLASQSCSKNKNYYCFHCLGSFWSQEALLLHEQTCRKDSQILSLPSRRKSVIQFVNFKHMFRLPFIVYFDIECMLVSNENPDVQDHEPISVCVYTKCCSNDCYSVGPVVFTGVECMDLFMDYLVKEQARVKNILSTVCEPIVVSDADLIRFEETTVCDVCGARFDGVDVIKCIDHDHLLSPRSTESNMRYVACNTCNLIHGKTNYRLPVIAHNSMKYDINHVLQKLSHDHCARVLARNSEQFISLAWRKDLVFIDSLNFLHGSLDSLVGKLTEPQLKPFLDRMATDGSMQSMLRSKCPFPYDFLDSPDRLNAKSLPTMDQFYNRLTETHISERQYHLAKRVWSTFGCRTFKDYLELYVKLDVMLLSAVFEVYRQSTFNHFGLDPAHYVSSPSMCMDAMLKMTAVELETLPSTEMYLFFTSSIRGGLCGTSHRYAEANNDHMSDYDPTQPTSHIIGLDANGLYAHALCQSLPTGGFEWISEDELKTIDIKAIPRDNPIGYFLQVDLSYPAHLHDFHNQLPLAPEKLELIDSMWSPYSKSVADSLGMKQKSGGVKLVTTLKDKSGYIAHYEALKLYLDLGLVITKIHRGVKFTQSPFLKDYIKLNNDARTKATTEFDIALYKLYNNCIYGKMMYNVFNQVNVKLVTSTKQFEKLAAKNTFKTSHVINPVLTCVAMKSSRVVCDKPIFVGASVLDLSKVHMYGFWYYYLQPMYQNHGLKALYFDTDSFYFSIQGRPSVYKDFEKYEHLFDLSNYPKHHFLYSAKRKKVLGLMKDVHAGNTIRIFCALRSKMYAVKTDEVASSDIVKAKGLKHHLLHNMKANDYVSCLRDVKLTTHSYRTIDRRHHKLTSTQQTKVGLSPFDDKRFYLSCGVHSMAYGHYKLHSPKSYTCHQCTR